MQANLFLKPYIPTTKNVKQKICEDKNIPTFCMLKEGQNIRKHLVQRSQATFNGVGLPLDYDSISHFGKSTRPQFIISRLAGYTDRFFYFKCHQIQLNPVKCASTLLYLKLIKTVDNSFMYYTKQMEQCPIRDQRIYVCIHYNIS